MADALDYDCGGGNSMSWCRNYIQYYSDKYGATYPMYLKRTVYGGQDCFLL